MKVTRFSLTSVLASVTKNYQSISIKKGGIMEPMLDKWLTLNELAAYLKISRTKLYELAQKNLIPASKIGAQWRFDREEIDVWMKNQKDV